MIDIILIMTIIDSMETMNRIFIIGCPGSGKSSLGRIIKDKKDLPLYYLDMIYHLPDKTHITAEAFTKKLKTITDNDKWIIDGVYFNYVKEYFHKADTIFYLDIPLDICLESVKRRSGVLREDFPYIEDSNDEVFHNYIRNFNINFKDAILKELALYPHLNIIIFHSYKEIDDYVSTL